MIKEIKDELKRQDAVTFILQHNSNRATSIPVQINGQCHCNCVYGWEGDDCSIVSEEEENQIIRDRAELRKEQDDHMKEDLKKFDGIIKEIRKDWNIMSLSETSCNANSRCEFTSKYNPEGAKNRSNLNEKKDQMEYKIKKAKSGKENDKNVALLKKKTVNPKREEDTVNRIEGKRETTQTRNENSVKLNPEIAERKKETNLKKNKTKSGRKTLGWKI